MEYSTRLVAVLQIIVVEVTGKKSSFLTIIPRPTKQDGLTSIMQHVSSTPNRPFV